MTEAEWMACTDPTAMLDFLRSSYRFGDRKPRLFGCACLRKFWRWLDGRPSALAVDVAERLADGLATRTEVEIAQQGAHGDTWDVLGIAALIVIRDPWEVLSGRFATIITDGVAGWQGRTDAARQFARSTQKDLLHDIFGSLPFRPVSINLAWLAWNNSTIFKLAQAIYDERTFDRLPILADALEEAGCTDADILGHCRGGQPHVRGCWAVDLILSRDR